MSGKIVSNTNKSKRKNPNNSRELSLTIINSVLEEGKLSHIVIREQLDSFGNSDEDNRDKAFISGLSLGTIERRITLDYIIDCYSKVKTEKLKPYIRGLLRMSVYQIMFMDRVPDSAACNEAVRLAKKRGFSSLAPFVNGVLRTVSRQKESIGYPDADTDFYRALEVKYSVPVWILELLVRERGRDRTVSMLKALYEREKGVSVRFNTGRKAKQEIIGLLEKDGVCVREISLADNMARISGFGAIDRLTAFQEGLIQVQDISSALVGQISDVKEGDICMDLCAAPGGKTVHIADLLHGTGRVAARDLTESKVRYIHENIARCRLENVTVQVQDATVFDEQYEGKADLVIVDAPCSGLGVMANKADIKYHLQQENIRELSKISQNILQCAVRYLKNGGTLIFSTCTMTKAENEDNRQWLIDNYSLTPSDITKYLSDELLDIGDNRKTAGEGYLKLDISKEYGGFFISKFVKEK